MATTAGSGVTVSSPGATRARRIVSRALAAGTAVVLVGALALGFIGAGDVYGQSDQGGSLLVAVMLGSAGMAVVGAILTAKAPASPLGPLYQVGAIGMLLAVTSSLYGARALGDLHWLPFVSVAGWMMQIAFGVAFGATFGAFLLFPDGRPPSRRWRVVWWLIWGGIAVASVGVTFGLRTFEFDPGTAPNPLALGPEALFVALTTLGGVAEFLGGLLAVVSVVARFRRSAGEERQQLRWLAWAAALILASVVAMVLTGFFGGPAAFDLAFVALAASVLVGLPVATAIAVLRYRLYDLDLVVKKTAIYSLVAIALTALYLVLLAAATIVGLGTVPAVLTFVLTITPARNRAHRIAERIVYGSRATPFEVLSEFTERVGETYSIDDVLPRMTQLLVAGTGAVQARTWIRQGRTLHAAAAVPPDTEPIAVGLAGDDLPSFGEGVHAFPVTHQGELLGAITLAMPANDPMDTMKERLSHGVASQAGLALRNVRLVEDLRASRRRIVAAQDERAKTLERNIHDGAQQQLVALTVRLRLAEQLAARDPASVVQTLRELQSDATTALEDLRDLARGIYPPLLADKGLVAALESQARKAIVPVGVQAGEIGRHPQEVESTVYFCVLEALNNIAKYAEATAATVSLARADGVLSFEVRDDGRGFDAGAMSYGTGLQGMADRLDAVGGSLAVGSEPGAGTMVRGEIPVAGVEAGTDAEAGAGAQPSRSSST